MKPIPAITTIGAGLLLAIAVAAVAAPTVTSVRPNGGPPSGNAQVVIDGSSFTGATAVHFGGNPASFIVNSDTSIAATSPAGSPGTTVDVTVTTPSGTSATNPADRYTYTNAPVVGSLSPNSGPVSGSTVVTITGVSFTGATAVHFGGSAASSFIVNADTSITATAPPGSAGTVDVTVTNAFGTSATSAADQYTYTPATPVRLQHFDVK